MKVEIFDNKGCLVKTIFSEIPRSYTGWLTWNTKKDNKKISSGIYYCRLTTNQFSCSQK